MSMRADRVQPGYSLAGFPNREITKVERFTTDKRGAAESWVRIYTANGSFDYPPDWPLDVWTNTSADLEEEES
jgi:hypothetical protein